jgi:hypothetical protein
MTNQWQLVLAVAIYPAYSHPSNKREGWNKHGGWDFVEKANA